MTQPDPLRPSPYVPAASAPATPVLSILSLVFGILGAVSGLSVIGGLPAIAGVVLGFIARRREPASKGLWLTGIITGFVGIAEALLLLVIYIAFIAIAVGRYHSGD